MATINATQTINKDAVIYTWTGVTTSTDTPTAIGPFAAGQGMRRASVFFGGTFGGATATLQGSIDGTNFAPMYDIGGNLITSTATKIQDFTSACLYFKPSVTGGTGDDVDIVIIARN